MTIKNLMTMILNYYIIINKMCYILFMNFVSNLFFYHTNTILKYFIVSKEKLKHPKIFTFLFIFILIFYINSNIIIHYLFILLLIVLQLYF